MKVNKKIKILFPIVLFDELKKLHNDCNNLRFHINDFGTKFVYFFYEGETAGDKGVILFFAINKDHIQFKNLAEKI